MKIHKSCLIIIAFFLSINVANAQTPNWLNFTEGSLIYCIKEDSNLMWIGTRGGLVRYNIFNNSVTFYNKVNSGLPDNHVIAIEIDSVGRKWIGTWNGFAIFDDINWTVYKSSNSLLPNNCVIEIKEAPDLAVWLGTSEGHLIRIKDTVWTIYNSSNSPMPEASVYSIAFQNDSVIWIGAWNKGLVRFDGHNWTVYNSDNSLLHAPFFIYNINIYNDTIWVACRTSLARIVDSTWTVYRSDTVPNLNVPPNGIYQTFRDNAGNLWIGTSEKLIQLKPNGQRVIYTTSNSGLPCNDVWKFAQDITGKLWLGTYGKGVVKFYGTHWDYLNTSETELINNDVAELKFDKDGLLWGISNENYCLESSHDRIITYDYLQNKWHTWSQAEMNLTYLNSRIESIMIDSANNKWFLSSDVLLKYDNSSWSVFPVPDSLRALYNYSTGALNNGADIFLIYTYQGLLRFMNGDSAFFYPHQFGINNNTVYFREGCVDGNNIMWLVAGSNISGIVRSYLIKYDGINFSTVEIPYQGIYNNVSSVHADHIGNLWIGFPQGPLIKYNISSSQFTTDVDINVDRILIDKDDNLWITFPFEDNPGLLKYTPGGAIINFNVDNSGLSGNGPNMVAIDNFNNKWIGITNSGIAVFNENGIYLPASIEAPVTDDVLLVYPNPANNLLTITYNGKGEYEVFNMKGQVVKNSLPFENQVHINLSGFSRGMYFVRVVTGEKCIVKKFIKE